MCPASLRSILSALAALTLLSGCAGYPAMNPFFKQPSGPPTRAQLDQPPANKANFWSGDTSKDEASILVRIGEQRAYFYRGRKVVGATHISTGKKGYDTPTGSYRVIQKDKNHVSTLYGDFVGVSGEVVKANVSAGKDEAPEGSTFRGAKMPYFLRFSGAHGLHSGRVPNYPASHGCVRLPTEMAKHFFDNAEMGTPVYVED